MTLLEQEIAEELGVSPSEDLLAAVRELKEAAFTDALTGLPNRRAFEAEWAKRDRRGRMVTLVDIDNFKTINDTLGHLVGDAMLQHAAHRLRAQLRAGDFLARLGGDEFAIITRGNEGPALRSRLRCPAAHSGGVVCGRISYGSGWNLDDADRRMYAGKSRAAAAIRQR